MNNVNVITTKKFRREAKKYLKKYPSLKRELEELNKLLKVEPIQGVKLTENTYKIRISVKSKNKGKSGGLRIISFIYVKMPKKAITYILNLYVFIL